MTCTLGVGPIKRINFARCGRSLDSQRAMHFGRG
jgi:hypothetical protein